MMHKIHVIKLKLEMIINIWRNEQMASPLMNNKNHQPPIDYGLGPHFVDVQGKFTGIQEL